MPPKIVYIHEPWFCLKFLTARSPLCFMHYGKCITGGGEYSRYGRWWVNHLISDFFLLQERYDDKPALWIVQKPLPSELPFQQVMNRAGPIRAPLDIPKLPPLNVEGLSVPNLTEISSEEPSSTGFPGGHRALNPYSLRMFKARKCTSYHVIVRTIHILSDQTTRTYKTHIYIYIVLICINLIIYTYMLIYYI